MKNIRLIKYDKHSEFLKIFISYLLAFLIPMSLIIAGTCLFANNNASVQIEKAYEGALEAVKNDVDKNFEKLGAYAFQMSETPWVKKFMYGNDIELRYGSIDPTIYQNSIDELNLYKHINGFVSDLAVCFNDNDLVISNIGKDNFDSFFNDAIKFKGIDSEQWKEVLSVQNNGTIKPPAKVLQNKQQYSRISYIQTLPIAQKKPYASFIAFIDEGVLKELINDTFITTEGCICIFDSDNNFIVCNSMNENLQQLISDEKNISDVKKSKLEKIKLADGKEYKAFYSESSVNDWGYIAYVPSDTIATKVYDICLLIFIICLISLIIGIVLTHVLAKRSYAPLVNLVKTIQPDFLSSNRGNEYVFLHEAMNTIQEQERTAALKIKLYEPIARNSFFIQLLKGATDINSDLLKALNIRFSGGLFTCISVLFSEEQPVANDLDSIISAVISEQAVSFFIVDEDKENKTIILNYAYEQQIEQFFTMLKKHFDAENISYKAIGVGKTYQNIADIQKSYNEAKMALDYRFVYGKNNIIYADKIETINENSAYYCPIGTEEKLINLLKCGNWEGALKICREIETKNLDGEQINCVKHRALYYHLAVTALKVVEKDSISIKKNLNPEGLLSMSTTEEMRAYITEFYRCICQIITTEVNEKNIKFRQDIFDYLNNNFNDSNLNLSTMAEKFDISPTYLSRLVKNQTGMNFLDNLNRKRIEAAKLLLKENITILQVGQLVGYDSDITFRRQFKKYEGITPGEYKKHVVDNSGF